MRAMTGGHRGVAEACGLSLSKPRSPALRQAQDADRSGAVRGGGQRLGARVHGQAAAGVREEAATSR